MTLDLSGPWAGVLDTGYKRTHVAFELTRGENGGYGGAAVVLGSPGAAMPVEKGERAQKPARSRKKRAVAEAEED